MNPWKRLRAMLTDPERSLRERVFLVLTICAIGMGIIALLGDVIYGDNPVEIVLLLLTAVCTPALTWFGLQYHQVELASRAITIGVIFIIMPGIFFFGGGSRGGAVPWLVFSYLYIGLVMTGAWRRMSLLLMTGSIGIMYLTAYYHPEWIVGQSHTMSVLDSGLAVVEVGLVCFVMTWFQSMLLREENRRAKEETRKFEELNRSQNRFFSSMSHEIRTPINSILGLNEIILRQEDASEEIIRDAGNIQGAGRMLLSLVNDILDLSKIEAGKMDIVPVNYSVATMISEIVNMMWLRAEQKGLTFNVEVDPYLPSELYGDEVRIRQILINLLNNAVKYTKEGSVTLHVEMQETKGDRASIMFSVADTGMGIKQDSLPYLFDAFQRADEEKNRKIEGTGLGLSIVKQLVELMDGKIAVNSVYTQGSTFVVTLWQTVTDPKAIGSVNLTSYGSIREGKRHEAGFTAPEARILIVDDNEMNLEVEKKLMSGTKMVIDTALGGAQAISMTLQNRYDMIFMDHLMPEMDGIECMQRIRKQVGGLNNHSPMIVLTANAGGENREIYAGSGFDGYLVKPVTGKQLEETLLLHLPSFKVNMAEGAEASRTTMNTALGYSKKIPLLIATSTMCDLPQKVMKDCQIDAIPFTVRLDDREYYDNVEVGTDELIRYLKEGRRLISEPPTVEEFEVFFGKELKKAHQVIYITMAPGISKEYELAKEAAKAYGDVFVFNSGLNSASMGLLVLLAYQMAKKGRTPGAIMEELQGFRNRSECSFVTDDAGILMKRGFISRGLYTVMTTLSIRPFIRIRENTATFGGFSLGELKRSYGRYVDYALPRGMEPDPDILMVPYVDLSAKDLQWLKERILKRVAFSHIVFVKTSAAMSLNCGPGAFGLLFLRKGGTSYQLGEMLSGVEDVPEEEEETIEVSAAEASAEETVPVEDLPVDSAESDAAKTRADSALTGAEKPRADSAESDAAKTASVMPEGQWYEGIPNIDPETGIRNSGSEEGFWTVLEMFYRSMDEKAEELETFYEKGSWQDYMIRMHALKSSARIIGAKSLSKQAEELEKAAKEGEISRIREQHGPFLAEYRGMKRPLSAVYEGR